MLWLLTVDQKQHINDSNCCLQLFQCNKKKFLRKYVTMDETWIHHFTSESNWRSAEWTAAGESYPNRPKIQTSLGKVLVSVFWDAQGISFIEYLVKKKKCSFTKTMYHVTSQSQQWQNYMNCTLNCFHTDPILQIWSPATTGCLQNSKNNASGKEIWLQWRSDIGNWGVFWGQSQIVLQKGIELLEKHWNQCITLEGDYVDE